MSISAPYAFIPLSEFVYEPDWAPYVSHDVPFQDGVSGVLEIDLKTHAPLLVGGARRAARDDRAGEVWPASTNKPGDWMIPSSSLTGTLRNVIEIATFGAMKQVDDKKFAFRDIDHEKAYRQRLVTTVRSPGRLVYQSNVKFGWLRRVGSDLILRSCRGAKIQFEELGKFFPEVWLPPEKYLKNLNSNSEKREYKNLRNLAKISTATERYQWWEERKLSLLHNFRYDHDKLRRHRSLDRAGNEGFLTYARAWFAEHGEPGQIVFTGKMQDGVDRRSKKNEWVFFDQPAVGESVTDDDILLTHNEVDLFYRTHEPAPGKPGHALWGARWKSRLENRKEAVPVFWVGDRHRDDSRAPITLGFAQLLKISNDRSIGSMVPEAHKSKKLSFADLLFGVKAETSGKGLRRRVSSTSASLTGKVCSKHGVVLLSPKPTYYPTYVRQPARRNRNNDLTVIGETLASYSELAHLDDNERNALRGEVLNPQISGYKRYPAKLADLTTAAPQDNGIGRSVRQDLNMLEPDGSGAFQIVFHNLRPVELGALLWALTWGEGITEKPMYCHQIGMGRPFGMGQVSFSIQGAKLIEGAQTDYARPASLACWVQNLIIQFSNHMDGALSAAGEASLWRETDQVQMLLAMASPAIGDQNLELLRPMALQEFARKKRARFALAPYPRDDAYDPH